MIHATLATVTAALLTFAAALPADAQEGAETSKTRKPSNCFALAGLPQDAQILKADFPTQPEQDHVRIHYVDHAEFLIQAGGLNAVTDFVNFIGWGDYVPDVVTMNNAHDSHYTDTPDPRIPHVLKGWPEGGIAAHHELDLGAMLVRNVPTDTRGPFGEGALRDGNSIFVFEAGGLCIGHLGHLHQIPNDAQYAAIGRLDVVMVPVDGGYTLDAASMAGVIDRLRARVIIPMHWFSEAGLEMFLTDMQDRYAVVDTGGPDLILSQQDLPATPTILVLRPELLP